MKFIFSIVIVFAFWNLTYAQDVTVESKLEESVLYADSHCLSFSFFIPGKNYVIYVSQ